MIIDTHCHYNLDPLENSFENDWSSAQEKGVKSSIIVGTTINNSKTALKQALTHKNLFASIGLHPGYYTKFIKDHLNGDKINQELILNKIENDLEQFFSLIDQELNNKDTKLIAVGEIGLDYYRLRKKGLKRELAVEMQKKVFRAQFKFAVANQLPVILHIRDQIDRINDNAYYDTLTIIEEIFKMLNKTTTIILHCVSGPSDYIKKALDLGAYIGIAGNATYDNAPEIRAIIKNAPSDKLLLETDAPYLAPSKFKAEICKPEMILETAKFLEQEMSLNLDIIKDNTFRVFPKIKEAVE